MSENKVERVLTGKVVSNSRDKTIAVMIERNKISLMHWVKTA
jgi:small subunit ribosomal protein S17